MNISELIGNTPLIDLSRLVNRPGVELYGKLEGNNPGGSVKDRPALYMIAGALERGDVGPDTRLIEATSGNTGIALAMIAADKGIPLGTGNGRRMPRWSGSRSCGPTVQS